MATPESQFWQWKTFAIRYQHAGDQGPVIVLIHGFGASSDHWRKNIPEWSRSCRVYALDLLGFGGSAKPKPGFPLSYTFETWGSLLSDFCQEVIREPVFLVGNSIGCIVALQKAVGAGVLGVVLLNCSLRLLHERKIASLPWYRRWSTPVIQKALGYPPLGRYFFSQLARPQTVRNLLKEAYQKTEAVTDELVNLILKPALDPGAADVFLAFIQYSQGPLAEDLLPQVQCPVLILWGEADPWEPIGLAQQEFSRFPQVTDFIPLAGLGHCPHDEDPERVNPLVLNWIQSQVDKLSPSSPLSPVSPGLTLE
jgi:pimeloyl-ACP methyl ester carboxylesterase